MHISHGQFHHCDGKKGAHAFAMTPKQSAARLLLAALKSGAKHPTTMTREEMATVLDSRISDEKRAKILGFVEKIETPYVERLIRLTGEGADDAAPAEGAAPQA
jgi:hypothetical protein